MPKTAMRLFREPQQVERAIKELQAKGYGSGEIGIIIQEKGNKERLAPDLVPVTKDLSLPNVGPVVVKGAVASAISEGSDLRATLAELWGIPEETLNYYQLALSWGGVIVSVHAEGERLKEAQQLLRQAGAKSSPGVERHPMWSTCPPFDIASRMSETNPIDAPMTGDFRRY
jgi:hypothetical protein